MYVVRMPCGSHAGSCGQKQSRAKGRSLRWPQVHPPAAPLLGWRGDGVPRAEPSQTGRRQNGRLRAASVRPLFSVATDCHAADSRIRRGAAAAEAPKSRRRRSRLFKVIQSCPKWFKVQSPCVQSLFKLIRVSSRRRLRNAALPRISSNNLERGCAMRLCPDDDLTGPTGHGQRHPPDRSTAGADAAVARPAPALGASAVLKP